MEVRPESVRIQGKSDPRDDGESSGGMAHWIGVDMSNRIQRFWERVDASGGEDSCWLWIGYIDSKGYGGLGGRRAHRIAYELLVGPIPHGLQLDHLCRVTSCINPRHLEPVTNAENARRARAARTHCKRGHEFTPENTYYSPKRPTVRQCRACSKEQGRELYRRRHAPQLVGQEVGPKTHCKNGHEFTAENTRIYAYCGKRQRICITCNKERCRQHYLARKGA